MAEKEYYEKKLEIERDYYNKKLKNEFKVPERINESAHWNQFEHSAGVAAAAATMTLISVSEQEGLEATVAAMTTVCATARATTSLITVSGAKTINLIRSLFH